MRPPKKSALISFFLRGTADKTSLRSRDAATPGNRTGQIGSPPEDGMTSLRKASNICKEQRRGTLRQEKRGAPSQPYQAREKGEKKQSRQQRFANQAVDIDY